MIKRGSVYGLSGIRPPEDKEVRLLATRYWPRGVKKQVVDFWLKGLGTEAALIKRWKAGSIGWEEFSRAYIEGLKSSEAATALTELRSIVEKAGTAGTVLLLCTCKEQQRCHTELLKEFIERRAVAQAKKERACLRERV